MNRSQDTTKTNPTPTRRLLVAAILLLAVGNICLAQENTAASATAAATPQAAREDRLEWFREARFGMFIHWGPYSELAGEWNGQQVKVGRNAEWIMHFLKIPAPEYRELARKFNPQKFDAEECVRLAKAAGMRYLVFTAKHHDGFAMYHSKVSPYNIVDWTPFKRDPLKELQEACDRAGIRLCVYYSHSEDWDDPDAGGPLDTKGKMPPTYERYLEQKSKPQLKELLSNYGPIGLVWFDRGLFTTEQAQSFVDLVRGIQPACLINGRVGNYEHELMGDYQNMNDNGMPPGGIEEDWETPQTLNDTWGYSRFDTDWKKPEDIVRRLVEIVSKGGNYVLNIGPRGDGTIPEASVAILEKVGEWMQQNGESIHGAKASPFAELPWGRCTVKGNVLYLHVFKRPADGTLDLPGLRSQVKKACLLADPGKILEASRQGSAVRISLPSIPADAINTVVAVELDGPPRVDPPVIAEKAGKPVVLDYLNAVTSGNAVKRFNRRGQFHISKWTGPADHASWRVRFLEPGRYGVRLVCAGAPGRPSGNFVLSAGDRKVEIESPQAADWYKYVTLDAGVLEITVAGEQELVLRPARELGQDLMYFKSLRLERLPSSSAAESMRHGIAAGEAGKFCGWPANNGVWSWDGGKEILVGYTFGDFVEQKGHNMKGGGEEAEGLMSRLARSTDGGLTWKSEDPANYVGDGQSPIPSPGGIDFQAPGFAMRVVGTGYHGAHDEKGSFFVSENRGRDWQGPYQFNGLMEDPNLKGRDCTARTAYLVTGPDSCLLFMSSRRPDEGYRDKTFVAETTDGGKTFRFVSWIVPLDDPHRAVMPSVSRLKHGSIVAALRRREARTGICWVDAYGSGDNGRTWTFLSRVGETGKKNGNPPALVALDDGRLACAYGDRTRAKVFARLSNGGGKTWGEEVVLRDDYQPDTFGDMDFGYPRLAVNKENQIVALYYWATQDQPQQHIAATIWRVKSR